MKNKMKLFLLAGVIILGACAKKQSAQQLLKDDKMRDEIMTAISNDHNMTEEMINHLTTIPASREIVLGSCTVMDTIMASNFMRRDTVMQENVLSGMLRLLRKDSILCDKTCTRMLEDPRIKKALEKKL